MDVTFQMNYVSAFYNAGSRRYQAKTAAHFFLDTLYVCDEYLCLCVCVFVCVYVCVSYPMNAIIDTNQSTD